MIAIGLLTFVAVVIALRARRRRKAAEQPEAAYLVTDADLPKSGVQYRFRGSRGQM